MTSIQQLLRDIDESRQWPRNYRSVRLRRHNYRRLLRYRFYSRTVPQRGTCHPREFLEIMGAMTNFGMGNLGFSGMMAVNAQFMRGIEEETYYEVGRTVIYTTDSPTYLSGVPRVSECPSVQRAHGRYHFLCYSLPGGSRRRRSGD